MTNNKNVEISGIGKFGEKGLDSVGQRVAVMGLLMPREG